MDIAQLIDIFLHLDKHLSAVVADFGPWVYALLFLIIFVETGLVVMPFLPGDSLLFVAGAIAGLGAMDLPLLMVLLTTAAILGDALNYSIVWGRGSSHGSSRGSSTRRRSTAPTRSTSVMAASRSSSRASCRSCVRSPPSWRASPR